MPCPSDTPFIRTVVSEECWYKVSFDSIDNIIQEATSVASALVVTSPEEIEDDASSETRIQRVKLMRHFADFTYKESTSSMQLRKCTPGVDICSRYSLRLCWEVLLCK